MTREDVTTKVLAIVAHIAKTAPAEVDVNHDLYRDVGVKSTAALDLLLTLEEEFDVQIPDEQFGDARTVDALVTLLDTLAQAA